MTSSRIIPTTTRTWRCSKRWWILWNDANDTRPLYSVTFLLSLSLLSDVTLLIAVHHNLTRSYTCYTTSRMEESIQVGRNFCPCFSTVMAFGFLSCLLSPCLASYYNSRNLGNLPARLPSLISFSYFSATPRRLRLIHQDRLSLCIFFLAVRIAFREMYVYYQSLSMKCQRFIYHSWGRWARYKPLKGRTVVATRAKGIYKNGPCLR